MILAGWGKAKFREPSKESPFDPQTEILFEVKGSDYGILDNVTGTMEEFLTKQKATTPDPKICYHTCKQQPEGDWLMEKDPLNVSWLTKSLTTSNFCVEEFSFGY